MLVVKCVVQDEVFIYSLLLLRVSLQLKFRHQLGKPCQLCTLLVYLGSQLFDIMIEQLGLVLHDLLINESLSDLKLLVLTDVKVWADE